MQPSSASASANPGSVLPGNPQRGTHFGDLPLELQSLVFAYSAAPLQTCRASATVHNCPQLIATWLLCSGEEFPLLTAARHQQWDACISILGSAPQRRAYELAATLPLAAAGGNLQLVTELLNQDAWADWAWGPTRSALETAHGVARVFEHQLQGKGYSTEAEVSDVWQAGHPLTVAAQAGQLGMCELFITTQGIDTSQLHSAFCAAAGADHLGVMQLLLRNNPDINTPQPGEPSLCVAAKAGHLAVVQFLLDQGADPNNKPGTPWSGLHLDPGCTRRRVYWFTCPFLAAAEGGNLAVLQLLAGRGAKLEACWHEALAAAAEAGHVEAVQWLLTSALPVLDGSPWLEGEALLSALTCFCREYRPWQSLELWQEEGLWHWYEYGTPLTRAARAGQIKVVQLLLESGQHCGLDEEALAAAAEDGHLSVMQLLIQQGADPCWDTTEFQHGRALANAIKHMQPGATLLLLQAGAVPGESALVQAATKTNPRVVQALLDHGATDAEANALTAAARSSRQCWPVVELLLHMSHKEPDTADPNSLCSRLGLALVAAAGNGQYQMVEHLLSYQPQGTSDSSAPASVSQEDLDKALCAAACMGHDAPCVQPNGSWYTPIDSSRFESRDYCTIVMLLVENGADVDAQEDAPMRGALRFGDAEMRDLLMEFGANPNVQPMKTVDDEIMEGMQRFHEELMAGKYPELHVHGSALECASL